MEKLHTTRLIEEYCKIAEKWAVVVFIPETDNLSLISQHAPFIDTHDDVQCVMNGQMFVICDTEKECYEAYGSITGPDNNKHGMYAYTVNNKGVIEDENT